MFRRKGGAENTVDFSSVLGGVAHLVERYIRIVEVVSSSLIVSTKYAETRLNSGSFSFVYEKCTNYFILLRIETARSSSFGYKCAYVFQVVSIFE